MEEGERRVRSFVITFWRNLRLSSCFPSIRNRPLLYSGGTEEDETRNGGGGVSVGASDGDEEREKEKGEVEIVLAVLKSLPLPYR